MDWDRGKERRAGKAMSIGGSIYGIVFMVIWCGIAAAMGAGFMLVLGLPMLGFMIFRLVVLLKKAKGASTEPRKQSEWSPPVREPWNAGQGRKTKGFCPYCGEETEEGFSFCPKCGRRL